MLWVFLLLIIFIAITVCCYFKCFHSPANRPIDPYSQLGILEDNPRRDHLMKTTRIVDNTPHQDIYITSFDGLQLYGRYYHIQNGAPVEILFHGYRSHALRDCSGGFMLARKMGMNVLLVDQRAHGRSEGSAIGFGVLERRDCLSWAKYAAARFGEQTPIILSGISMGGATVIMASSLPLPKNVVCVLADCPYTSPSAIIRKVCRDKRLPDKLLYPFVYLSAKLFGRFSLTESSAICEIANTNLPVLLIHGEEDDFVPCQMSKEISAACKSKCQLQLFPDADHGMSYMVDPVRYEEAVAKFLWEIPALQPELSANDYVQKRLNGETDVL